METIPSPPLKKMGFLFSFSIYVPAALLLFVLTHTLIPFLHRFTGWEIILFWFLVGGLGVFLPLIFTGIIILKKEGRKLSRDTWTRRLRFRKVNRSDLLWSIGGIVAVLAGTWLLMKIVVLIVGGKFESSPSFMFLEPLSGSRLWILAAWLPYWILNILGEEFLWRGVMFPRQELAFGKWTWLVHGLGWGIFHIAFGWHLFIILLPIIFIESWVVQKTRNSWNGVIIHAGINGPSFIAIALGLM
jgi:membrane protease YdiL (CAAX protease family)